MLTAIVARDAQHLKDLVDTCILANGTTCDLNHIDVSHVTDMSGLFRDYPFNGDISKWDTCHVTDMSRMFMRSGFKGDISKWDVSNVVTMFHMFDESDFCGDISGWDVSKVESMSCMFSNCSFSGDLSRWDISSVRDMSGMFAFNLQAAHKPMAWNIAGWDVSRVKDMRSMFRGAAFPEDISGWKVGSVLSLASMFEGAFHTCDLGAWRLSPLADTTNMFARNRHGLAKQTPCKWNVLFFLQENVLPSVASWADVFATIEPIAQALGVGSDEHAQLILDEYARRNNPASSASVLLPSGTVEASTP